MAEWGDTCRQAFAAACSNIAALVRQFDPHACPVCGIYFDSRRAVKVHIARAHVASTEAACANLSTIVTYEGSQSVREAAMTTRTAGSSSPDPLRPHVDAVSFVASSSSQRHAQQPHTHESGNRRDTSVDCLSQAVVAAGSPVQAGVSGLVAASDSSPVDHRFSIKPFTLEMGCQLVLRAVNTFQGGLV